MFVYLPSLMRHFVMSKLTMQALGKSPIRGQHRKLWRFCGIPESRRSPNRVGLCKAAQAEAPATQAEAPCLLVKTAFKFNESHGSPFIESWLDGLPMKIKIIIMSFNLPLI